MRVILINPWDQTVSEATYSGDYRDYYRLLSGPTAEGFEHAMVDCMDMTALDGALEDHLLVVDDCGLLVQPQAYFELCGRTFAGRALVVRDSDDVSSALSPWRVKALVTFLPIGSTVTVGPCTVRSFDTAEELMAWFAGGIREGQSNA